MGPNWNDIYYCSFIDNFFHKIHQFFYVLSWYRKVEKNNQIANDTYLMKRIYFFFQTDPLLKLLFLKSLSLIPMPWTGVICEENSAKCAAFRCCVLMVPQLFCCSTAALKLLLEIDRRALLLRSISKISLMPGHKTHQPVFHKISTGKQQWTMA